MTCQFCGHGLAPDARACARCGAPRSAGPVGTGTPAAPPAAPGPAPLAPTLPEPPPSTLLGAAIGVPSWQASAPAGPAAPAEPPAAVASVEHRLAGLGTRLGGLVLDGLLLGVAQLAVLAILVLVQHKTLGQPEVMGPVTGGLVVASLLYLGIGNGLGATLGKRLVGSRVVDARTGARIGVLRGLLRAVVYWLECLPAGLPLLSVLARDRRAWHDRAAGSVVTWTPALPRRPREP